MSNNIVEIDLSKLEADIIETQNKLALLMSTKKYAQSIAVSTSRVVVNKEVAITKEKPTKASSKTTQTPKKKLLSVTDFILKFLKSNDKVDSNAINKAYSVYVSKTEKQVEGNIANALSRLKTAKKVNNEPKPNGKKGSLWFLIKQL